MSSCSCNLRYVVTSLGLYHIKMDSDESHLRSFIYYEGSAKSQRQCPQTTTFEERGEPKRNRTEVVLLTSLAPYHLAKPAHKLILVGC